MKISKVECHALLVPNYAPEACSSAQDDIVVEVHTDEGLTGIGEVDTNPWAVASLIKSPGSHVLARSLEEILVGCDPLDTEALWEKMYVGSLMAGRRGAGICAMGAIDMALWDLRGKILGLPCWKLLGGARKDAVIPYASLLPAGYNVAEQRESLMAMVQAARTMGFRAAKLEVCFMGPYAHNGVQGSRQDIVGTVAACRDAVGPDFTLMLDVCYGWDNAKEALRALHDLEPYNLYFVETPLRLDDLRGYAYLHDHSPIRIAAGELQNGRFEFRQLMDEGKIDVAQPDIGRVGGLTEARRVCDMAGDRGVQIVPHCWKSAIGIMASLHLAIGVAHCPFIEFLPAPLSGSRLRQELVLNEPELQNGALALPDAPGLGVKLNRKALDIFSADAQEVYALNR